MKRTIFFLILMISAVAGTIGQDRPPRFEERLDEFQNERVAFLTRRLDLSPQEAEKFWPLYNEYLNKRDEVLKIRRHKPDGPPDFDKMTEKELDEMLTKQLETEVKLVELKRDYFIKIRQILPAKKVAILYGAEQAFMNHMINRFREESPDRRRGSGRE